MKRRIRGGERPRADRDNRDEEGREGRGVNYSAVARNSRAARLNIYY